MQRDKVKSLFIECSCFCFHCSNCVCWCFAVDDTFLYLTTYNVVFNFKDLFYLFFLTNVMGIEIGHAGIIIAIGIISFGVGGSIGIIGIALILALSNGINIFIAAVQEDTLSTFPLTINRVTQDYQAMLQAMTGTSEEIDEAVASVAPEFLDILREAAVNIRAFHEKQVRNSFIISEQDGVVIGQKVTPIEKVGLYVPGGTAAYPSTVLMDAIPARVAGVGELVMVTPPNAEGKINPVILAAASVPVLLKPNAGLPRSDNGKTVFDVPAKEFANSVAGQIADGVRIAGGCCGTTPEYIGKVSALVRGIEKEFSL